MDAQIGYQKAQGYLVCRPVTADVLTAEIVDPVRLHCAYAGVVPVT